MLQQRAIERNAAFLRDIFGEGPVLGNGNIEDFSIGIDQEGEELGRGSVCSLSGCTDVDNEIRFDGSAPRTR